MGYSLVIRENDPFTICIFGVESAWHWVLAQRVIVRTDIVNLLELICSSLASDTARPCGTNGHIESGLI